MAQFPEFVVVFPESIEIDKGLYAVGVGVGAGVVGAGVVGAGVVGAGVVDAGVVDAGVVGVTSSNNFLKCSFKFSFEISLRLP